MTPPYRTYVRYGKRPLPFSESRSYAPGNDGGGPSTYRGWNPCPRPNSTHCVRKSLSYATNSISCDQQLRSRGVTRCAVQVWSPQARSLAASPLLPAPDQRLQLRETSPGIPQSPPMQRLGLASRRPRYLALRLPHRRRRKQAPQLRARIPTGSVSTEPERSELWARPHRQEPPACAALPTARLVETAECSRAQMGS